MRVLLLAVSLVLPAGAALAQQVASLPDGPEPAWRTAASSSNPAEPQAAASPSQQAPDAKAAPSVPATSAPLPQPKRILGLMPNYRAVSSGVIPPPPSSKEAFMVATGNTFDYSSFVFVGLTSLIAKGTDAHPDLGKGVSGLWAYTWRGFVDKADGNYLVIWALPTVLHQDERYYAMSQGSKWKRLGYSLSQVAVARDYHGKNVPNYSEILGRGAAQAIGTTYYPASDRNFSDLSAKFGYALLRDGATNAFREFWPDIAVHVLHRHP